MCLGGGGGGEKGEWGDYSDADIGHSHCKIYSEERERERAAHPGQFLDVNLTSKRGKNKEKKGRASQKGFVYFLCLNFIRRFCTMKL